MKQLEQLATGNTTSADMAANFEPTIWSEKIVEYSKPRMFFEQIAIVNTELVGQGAMTIRIPIVNNNLTLTESATEAVARTMTKLDNLDTVLLEPVRKCSGIALSHEVVINNRVDMIEQAMEQMALWRATTIDVLIRDELETATSNVVYGGNATSVGTLATGDTITTDVIANARQALREDNFGMNMPGDPQMVLFIHPIQEKVLIKDSQFVNAAEYGSNEVVLNGEIGKLSYLGVKIVVTTQVQAKTIGGDSWGADGHMCLLLDPKYAVLLAWKEEAHFDSEYEKDERLHKLYLDIMVDAELGQDEATCLVNVTDA